MSVVKFKDLNQDAQTLVKRVRNGQSTIEYKGLRGQIVNGRIQIAVLLEGRPANWITIEE